MKAKQFKQIIRFLRPYISQSRNVLPLKRAIAWRNVDGQAQFEVFNDFSRVFYQTGLESDWEGILPFATLSRLASSMNDGDEIKFTGAGPALNFETNHMDGMMMATHAIDDYLVPPTPWTATAVSKIPLVGIGMAATKDEARPVLTNIAFLRNMNMVVAADGFRLHIRHYKKNEIEGDPDFEVGGFHVSAFRSPFTEVEFMGKEVLIRGKNWQVRSALNTFSFPDISKVMPGIKGIRPIVIENSTVAASAINQVMSLTPKSHMVKFMPSGLIFGENESHITRLNSPLRSKIPVSVNLMYLVEALLFINGPARVYISDTVTPITIKGLSKTALIMPMHNSSELENWKPKKSWKPTNQNS